MVSARVGRGSLGCLLSALAVTVVLYFGVPAATTFWHCYQYEDRMRQEIEFAAMRSDDDIALRLRAYADTLELPPDARRIVVRRTPQRIAVWATYSESILLPFTTREVELTPMAERSF